MNRREAIKRTALMMGAAVSASAVTGLLEGCSPSGTPWSPQFLNELQASLVNVIAERILPRTDTPGAQDVSVPGFIDQMYGKYMTVKEQKTFAAGLAKVEADAQVAHQSGFMELEVKQQDEILRNIAKSSEDQQDTFFHKMRELTLLGYFTSEPVGREILHYEPIPGDYKGCVPIEEVGNVNWTMMR